MARVAQIGQRKEKRSYTLSPSAIAVLEEIRRERKAASTSSVLDDILHAIRLERKRKRLDRAVADYYSSLSDEEVREQSAWGDFAREQLADEVK